MFAGEYQEINLFFVSFWSFDGVLDIGANATGSGIRLFFNLLVFGSISYEKDVYSFSGVIDPDPESETREVRALSHEVRSEKAIDRKRALNVETL